MRLSIGLLVALGVIVSGCSNDASTSSDGDSRISFQVSGEAEEIAIYRNLVEAFELANPNIDVKLVPVADKDEHLQKLATSFAGGNPPDVFLVNFREYSQFVARDAIEPVEPHLVDTRLNLQDYYEAPLEAFTYDGELQCMPQNASSLVVYYNETLLQAAGLEPPAAEWTWEDFRGYAEALTDPGNDVRGLGIEANVIRFAPFVWSNGGEIVDDPLAPTRFTLDTPEALEAIEFLVSLVKDGFVPTEEELAAQDLETRFSTGKLGMFLSSRRDTPFFRENLELSWDVAALPIGQEPVGILHSDGYCISRGAVDLDAIMEFVAFAVGEDGATITALGGRTVPSLRSVAESGAFLNPAQPPAHPEVFLEAIPVLRRTPVIPTWPEIEDMAEEIFTRIFYEAGYTIETGLRELEDLTGELFVEGSQT